jgi:hypothetical protein
VVTAAKDFQVGSAGKGGADAENQFAGRGFGHRHIFNSNVLAPVEDCGLHGSFGEPAGGLDGIAADLNDLFNGVPADMEDFFNGVSADVKYVFNRVAADLEGVFDRGAAALDGALYRVWHSFLL